MVNEIKLEVINFEKEMLRVRKEVESIAKDDIENRIKYATEVLKQVTPVDTGEARRGWKNKIYKFDNEFAAGTIYNNVEHIEYLNQGSSQQAPQYFIEQVLLQIGILKPI